MKRILLILSMLTCLCLMAACGTDKTSEQTSTGTTISEAEYQQYAEQLLNQIVALDDASMSSLIQGGQLPEGMVAGLNSWKTMREELGDFKSVTGTEVTTGEDSVTIVVNAKFSKREGTYTLSMDTEGNVTGASFDKIYTTGEILEKSVLNTLMGMGTVFVVLIFISFVISLFKYIPDIQAKFSKKADVVQETAAEENLVADAGEVSEELVDDGELIAVITAAISAAMAAEGHAVSKDGLVVKSIRRSRK